MSSKYRSRIKGRKPRKIGGGVREVGTPEVIEKVQNTAQRAQRVGQKAYKIAKEVVPVAKKVGKETRKLYKGLSDENVTHSKDIEDFRHRSFHSYHHAHAFVNNTSPHVLHAHRAVANILAGGGIHPFHGNVRPKDFHGWKYPVKVPKQAYLDLARSDRESLSNALEDEYEDHRHGHTGAGLFHAVNATAHASAHWGRKQFARGQELHGRLKRNVPEHFDRLRKYTEHVQHGAEWVRDQIHDNRHAFKATAGLFASSDVSPISAVGEVMGSMEHHLDGAHSLTGEIADYASKAHAATGGSLKRVGKIAKRAAVVTRKGLRTGARVADDTAMAATVLGAVSGNAALVEYGQMAPMAAEAARVAALGIGQTMKTL